MVMQMLAVHPFGKQVGHSPPPRSVDPGYGDEYRDLAGQALALRLKKAHAQLLHGGFIFLVGAFSPERGRFKHVTSLACKVSRWLHELMEDYILQSIPARHE